MKTAIKNISEQVLDSIAKIWLRHSEAVLLLGCVLLPLKLSLTYFCFGPAILGWIAANRSCLKKKFVEYRWFFAPWGCFVLSLLLHSFFGFSPLRSLEGAYALIFYPIVLLAVADTFIAQRALLPLLALIAGQTLAGLHSVLDTATGQSLPRFFLGAVTESGQLALVVPLACGVVVTIHRFSKTKLAVSSQIKRAALAAISSTALCLAAFSKELFSFPAAIATTLVLILISFILFACKNRLPSLIAAKELSSNRYSELLRVSARFLEVVFLPILLAALVVNLKRGPWAGVVVASLVFSLIYSRKLVIPFITGVATIIIIALPVQTRLLQSSRDFFIPGGRSAIWKVGIELAERFPLGIGFRNSKFLHSYSAEIPKELTHFHNNIINILVESGSLSMILFLIWIFFIIRFAFTAKVGPALAPTAKAVGCALIAWQVAGFVEYNFGDTEVLFIVYVLLGAVAGMQRREKRETVKVQL